VKAAFAIALCAATLAACSPDVFDLPDDDEAVIGEIDEVEVDEPVKLADLAQRHGVSLAELVRQNPRLARLGADQRVPEGMRVRRPRLFVLPDAPRQGIVVNIAEMRLYHYGNGAKSRSVSTFPAAVGREEWETPTGQTYIAERIVDPVWYPPESIRAKALEEGRELPQKVPPGRENPLGSYALRLGWRKHLIHGTNQPRSIGTPATHGCIRLYPDDIERLFRRVRVGTPVRLVDQPYKVGAQDGELFLEAHAPTNGDAAAFRAAAYKRMRAWAVQGGERAIRWNVVEREMAQPSGVPVRVSGD
jgi:L,D-transpeptidase ErfK/SrfK